jgi:hypothetical protein
VVSESLGGYELLTEAEKKWLDTLGPKMKNKMRDKLIKDQLKKQEKGKEK